MTDTNKYIPRTLEQVLRKELENSKITILTGPRQSGKTTLLKKISSELEDDADSEVHFYNFDRSADLDFFKNQQKVEAFLKIRSLKKRLYIFVDEVQRKRDAGNFFKYFYDIGVNVKFFFTGSSSIELTDSFGDALTGRKSVFNLYPLSLQEIMKAELGDEFDYAKMGEPVALEKLKSVVMKTLIWGGYPEVNAQDLPEDQLKTLSELYESYVQKDVKDLLRVKNVSGFNVLVKFLAHSVGKQIFVEDLVKQTGLHTNTVNSYLDILEGTMISGKTENYDPEFTGKLPKSKRYYFVDNGMRNYAINQLQSDFRVDFDQIVANLLYSELTKFFEYGGHTGEIKNNFTLNHYHTYSDNFVDFIISSKLGKGSIPVVIRYAEKTTTLGKKIHEFINTQNPETLYIITEEIEEEQAVKDCLVKFVPLEQFVASLEETFAT